MTGKLRDLETKLIRNNIIRKHYTLVWYFN